MIQERVDSEWREGQRILILVFAGSWKGSRRLHKTALPLLGWHGAVRLKGHECQLCCLTCFSREKCCSLCLAAWFAVRVFVALGCNYQKLWRLLCSICALVQSKGGYPRSIQQGQEDDSTWQPSHPMRSQHWDVDMVQGTWSRQWKQQARFGPGGC